MHYKHSTDRERYRVTHFLGIVAYLLRVESAMACGGSEMGPTVAVAAAEGGAMEAIGTAALTEEMPQLKQRLIT